MVVHPSSSIRMAFIMKGKPSRLTRNPGVSLAKTTFLPRDLEKDSAVLTVSSATAMVLTISTMAITGTGWKKCMPMTWDGLLVAMAICRMDRQEVLLASMACLGQTLSAAGKTQV